jgi:glucokinase
MDQVLAIDLGGTKLAVGIVDEKGRVLARNQAPTKHGDPETVIRQALALASSLGVHGGYSRDGGKISALGLALPGVMDTFGETLLSSPSSGWKDVPFTRLFSKAFSLPVWANNDARAGALAEHVFGGAKGLSSYFWMTVSTGVGGAFFLEGQILRGIRGMAGEVGHLIVRPGGLSCTCGNLGCLEAEAAGPAWGRKARALDPSWKGDAVSITTSARAGDAFCLKLVDDVAEALARGMGAIVNLFDPEAIFLGGGVAEASDLLIPRIINQLPGLVLGSGVPMKTKIIKSSLGRDVALIGAACLALEKRSRE